jgi:hypothetical protein
MLKCISILSLVLLFIIYTPFKLTGDDIPLSIYNGVITQVTGRVDVKKSGENDWGRVFTGFSVAQYDKIKIQEDSSVDIKFDKQKGCCYKIRLQNASQLMLTSMSMEERTFREDILLDLYVGDIFIKVENLPSESKFRVRTPTSMVGVKGTRFRVRYDIPKE